MVSIMLHRQLLMPPPFEEWWNGHIMLPCPSPSVSGVSNLCLFSKQGHPCPLDTVLVCIIIFFKGARILI